MKKVLSTFLFLALVCSVYAEASVSFVAKTSHKTVQIGQRFQVTFTVNANGGNFTPPPFSSFEMSYGGGQSSSTQIINGKRTQTNSISYVLKANQAGTFEIKPALLVINGEEYRSNPLSIEVLKSKPNSAATQRGKTQQRKAGGQNLSDFIFMEVRVDKKSAFVGEKIRAVFTLYSQLPVSRVNPEKLPDLKGFWSENITDYSSMRLHNENIKGVNYQVAEVQEIILFPQRSGELVLDPLEMNAIVQVRNRRAQSIWDQMMGGGYENKEITLKSKAISLDIKALPKKGQPEGFRGAVGKFKLEMSSNKEEVLTNEAIDLNIKITGQGNLALVSAPDLTFPSDFESYDPEVKSNIKTTSSGTSGSKSFNYLLIPRHAGEFELEPYQFSYFDPKTERYEIIAKPPIAIQVNKGANEQALVYSPREKESIAVLNEDIHYLNTGPIELLNAENSLLGSLRFYSMYSFAFVFFLGAYVYRNKSREQASDAAGLRKSKAKKLAKKRMSKAKDYMTQADKEAFFAEISAALFGYYGDKFNIAQADLSQDLILSHLDDESLKKELLEVLNEAEMARFAPSSKSLPEQLYQKALGIIEKTEA